MLTCSACENSEDETCAMIEVGTGAIASKQDSIQALIMVESNFNIYSSSDNDYGNMHYILAKLKARTNQDGSLMDLQFETASIQYNSNANKIQTGNGSVFVQADLLKLNISKDVAFDLDKYIRLSVVGVSVGGVYKPIDELKLYAIATLDLFATGVSRRMSDMTTVQGNGGGADFEIAAVFKEKYKLKLGAKVDGLRKKIASDTYDTGKNKCTTTSVDGYCNSYSCSTDQNGFETCNCTQYVSTQDETVCEDIMQTDNYYQSFKQTTLYAQFVASISRHLSVFAGVEYRVNKFHDDNVPEFVSNPRTAAQFENSEKARLRYNAGLIYKF